MPREALDVAPIASPAQLHAAYVGAFDLYAAQPSEAALHMGYEIGRRAVELDVSVPELARIHHEALRLALGAEGLGDDDEIVRRGADFLAECLSAFEMVRRGFAEAQERAALERRQAALLRRLSALLADASLAMDRTGSASEMLRLVVEAARELTGAAYSRAIVYASPASERSDTVASGERPMGSGSRLVARLTELDGREAGSLEIWSDERGFSEFDNALLTQLAEMTAAALERTRRYR